MSTRIKNLRLLGIAVLVALLFNFPLITIFDQEGFIFGIPKLFFLVFSFWLVIIILLNRITRTKQSNG